MAYIFMAEINGGDPITTEPSHGMILQVVGASYVGITMAATLQIPMNQ